MITCTFVPFKYVILSVWINITKEKVLHYGQEGDSLETCDSVHYKMGSVNILNVHNQTMFLKHTKFTLRIQTKNRTCGCTFLLGNNRVQRTDHIKAKKVQSSNIVHKVLSQLLVFTIRVCLSLSCFVPPSVYQCVSM